MKRVNRSKAATLSRKRALIRSLIEQTGLAGVEAVHSENRMARVVELGSNIEYLCAANEPTTVTPVDRSERPSNIIPFPDLRAKG